MATPTPEQVIVGHQAAVAAVRRRVLAFAATAWRAQASYRTSDVDRLVGLIVPRVQAGQVQVATLTSAYLAQILTLQTGETVRAVAVDRAEVLSGRGVDPAVVYRRPAVQVYTDLAAGVAFADAARNGLRRLESIASMDLQMAKVRQARPSLAVPRVVGFRRTLTGAENCGMCVLASTQRYRREDLLPIHPGCDCGVASIVGESDPGQVINAVLVERFQAEVGETFGDADRGGRNIGFNKTTAGGKPVADYTDIIVRDHGEYGPTLTVRGQHFDGPRSVA